MSRLGTIILAVAILVIGASALFLGLHAASQPFAIHMVIIVAACAGFLIFLARRFGAESN